MNDKVVFYNYRLTKDGKVNAPTIEYQKENSPYPAILVSKFMSTIIDNIFVFYEGLMVHLSNIHAQPFAGDKRYVAEIATVDRPIHNPHMAYRYQIAWTK